MRVWLNGRFVQRDEATISVFDAGLQHGIGLFETMLGVGPRVFRVDAHLQRLVGSARQLRLSDSLRAGALAEAVEHVAAEAGLPRSRIRLTITGGDLNLLQSQHQAPVDPTILIVAQPATEYPESFFERGVRVSIADGRLNPLDPDAGHKTLNYWPRLRALQQAAGSGAAEALWFSVSNHLMSGSVSNVFVVKDGTLLTPIARGEEAQGALNAPVLPGITRAFIIDAAAEMDIGTGRQMLDIDALLNADEAFLTNSSWGVLPVVGVEAEAIADAIPGPITRRLREAWQTAISG
ncbi:MAG: aminotransferase class IV [Phycisphaerales bacterium]|nr:aminotransferase class IV [Phycisphaerales bacterium]